MEDFGSWTFSRCTFLELCCSLTLLVYNPSSLPFLHRCQTSSLPVSSSHVLCLFLSTFTGTSLKKCVRCVIPPWHLFSRALKTHYWFLPWDFISWMLSVLGPYWVEQNQVPSLITICIPFLDLHRVQANRNHVFLALDPTLPPLTSQFNSPSTVLGLMVSLRSWWNI